MIATELEGDARKLAIETVKAKHYTHSVPSGKSHYLQFEDAIARRAFHSGKIGLKKAEIEAMGYTELKLPGKERFVKPLTRKARKALAGTK